MNMLRDDPTLLDDAPIERRQMARDGRRDYANFARSVTIPIKVKPGDAAREHVWHHADAGKQLKYFCEMSTEFGRVFEECVLAHEGEPLDIIVYYDEIVPGNVLRPDNARKLQAIYWSIRQFPQEFLRSCAAWLPLGVMRSVTVKRFKAQFSSALKEIVDAIISNSRLGEGIVIAIAGKPMLFLATITNNLADGAALKESLYVKGPAGTQPCASCKNVLAKAFDESLPPDSYLVTLSCPDVHRFDLRTCVTY